MKNWGLDQIGFTVDPTLIFDMTKAKALYPFAACYHTKANNIDTDFKCQFYIKYDIVYCAVRN